MRNSLRQVSLKLIAFVLMACVLSSTVNSEEWSWNPFKKSSASRESSPIYVGADSGSKKSSWLPSLKMPKSPFSSSGPKVSSYSKSNTSTWSKMSRTSKQWWNKTTELLDPYPDPKPSRYQGPEASGKKGNWFTGMFQREDTKKIETVPDWLRQEAPKL
jgi:hypothetical protein